MAASTAASLRLERVENVDEADEDVEKDALS
jgi:hypothetical protein